MNLQAEIGAYHLDCDIDDVVAASTQWFISLTKGSHVPSFAGTYAENIALQNIQARIRMVQSYLAAQLLPWSRGFARSLLVLGSANVDEALRGFLTKYDCSSADLNPIGGISKIDLRRFLSYAADKFGYKTLHSIVAAKATPELVPVLDNKNQVSEEDMGMSFEELGVFGRLRKIDKCGPMGMYEKLIVTWSHLLPSEVAAKVKYFFRFYSINRHKTTVLTPCYHAENYSPDDNRFDHRQFLYNVSWPRQFKLIDKLAAEADAEVKAASAGGVSERGGVESEERKDGSGERSSGASKL